MLSFTEICHSLRKTAFVAVILYLSLTNTDALLQYETCCAIQTDCDGCNSVYKVNSITYCCPGCRGSVLVTGLICACTTVADPSDAPMCTVSNKVVGDYYYGRTSFYSGANLPSVSAPLLLLALCLLQLIKYLS